MWQKFRGYVPKEGKYMCSVVEGLCIRIEKLKLKDAEFLENLMLE